MNKTSTFGFTLIELMIVVIIIGILASIAYPSYRRYAMEAGRTDGQIALTQMANEVEKFYSECSAYPANLAGSPRNCAAGTLAKSNVSPAQRYTLTIAIVGSTYTLTATPQGKQEGDADCAKLTLTNTGVKGATGNKPSSCWKK